ncbi:DUF2339 domain-containing protein [Bacteroides sp. AM16-13]|mgnify:CR=1 FL=1|uniref:DUF2339 domain-containing protein n=1 Tax=Bacteroides TaxID=816 RepID=UPI000E741E84|nr:DUF2339 domain-containing protein [Bacteroides sp. AM16-13]RGD49281.1 DUF2339 domain-containing protein [Bacteroides sp. AM16-13]
MDDFNTVYALLVLVMLFILLSRLDNRFGKIEKELHEIKKRMEDYLKVQQNSVAEASKPKEEISEKETKDIPVMPQAAEHVKAVKTGQREEAVQEKHEPVVEAVVRETLEKTPEKTLETRMEEVCVEAVRKESAESSTVPVVLVTPATPVVPTVPKQKKQVNYEKFIGENLFGKIGILIFVIGVGFFVKYAIDKNWINETFRTVLGFLTGAVLLAVAERLQKKYRTFSSLLAGGAFAVFYLTVAIAFHYYHIFSQTMAFIILIGVTVFMSILSVVYNRRELAIISLVGGFLAPFIVSSGEGSYLVLFTYVSILNLGMFGLSIYKKWSELPMISFVFTCLIMGIFLLFNYTSSSTVISNHLFWFATLFYFIFLLPVFSILRGENMRTMSRGLVFVIITNNFIYLLSGALFLRNMGLSFKASGLLSLFIALVNLGLVLWLWKNRKEYKFLVHTTLGLVLTFVSITVPIQLDGNYITLLWASEMVLLLWLYVKSKIRVYEYAAKVLVGLTFVSYLMDVYSVMFEHHSLDTIFLNSSFATSLFVGLATGAFALLMEYYHSFFSTARRLKYSFWNPFMLIVSVIILYYTFMMEFNLYFEGATRSGVMFLFTAISISSVCYAFRKRFPITKHLTSYILTIGANVLVYIINIWGDQRIWTSPPVVLPWLTAVFVIANLYYVARMYYTSIGIKSRFTVYLNILATLLWLTMVRSFLWQVGVDDFSAGLSLSLSIAGFVQMGLGMRLHQKLLRMVSLATFGLVLLKLVFDDLWAMPTIGKIIVFIILGLILLILSFLYQKLKDVLFKNDEEETN